jgi:hypothetical protein
MITMLESSEWISFLSYFIVPLYNAHFTHFHFSSIDLTSFIHPYKIGSASEIQISLCSTLHDPFLDRIFLKKNNNQKSIIILNFQSRTICFSSKPCQMLLIWSHAFVFSNNCHWLKKSVSARACEVEKKSISAWINETNLETDHYLLVLSKLDGGITCSINKSNSFETFIYSYQENRTFARDLPKLTSTSFNSWLKLVRTWLLILLMLQPSSSSCPTVFLILRVEHRLWLRQVVK